MSSEQALLQYRPLLYTVAQKILGAAMDVDDIVQEVSIKLLKVDFSKIEDHRNYIIRAVTNTCLNHLDSLKRKKELLVDNWMNVKQNFYAEGFDFSFDKTTEMSDSIKKMMSKLNNTEIGVYMLKEVFSLNYNEITDIVKKKADHCRQLFHRSKEKLNKKEDKFSVDPSEHSEVYQLFTNACQKGEIREFIDFLLAKANKK